MLSDFEKSAAPGVAINLAVIGLVMLSSRLLPPQVPLFYGLPIGEEQLADKYFLMLPALVSLAIIIGNSILARLTASAFLKNVLLGIIYAVSTLSTITIVKIFLLIGPF